MRHLMATLMVLASAPLFADSLVGQWQGELNGQPLNLQLNADSSGVLDGNAIQYATQGSMLMIQSDNGLMAYSFKLQGGNLLVQGGDLPAQLTLHRPTASSSGKGKIKTAKQPTANTLNPALLAGK